MIRRLLHTLARDAQPIPASGNAVIKQSDNNTPTFEGIVLKPKENGPIFLPKNENNPMPFMFLYSAGLVPYRPPA